MRLAFYRSNAPTATRLDWWINALSGGEGYSHVELVYGGGKPGAELCFSSRPPTGCAWKVLNLSDPSTWKVVDIGGTPEQEEKARQFCWAQNGKRYDWIACTGVRFPPLRLIDHPGRRWFCSEVSIFALQFAEFAIVEGYHAIEESPNSLLEIVEPRETPLCC